MVNYKIPSSRYEVYCGLYDTRFQSRLHQIDGETKIKLSIQSNYGNESKSISIYKDDLEMMIEFLQSIKQYVSERKEEIQNEEV